MALTRDSGTQGDLITNNAALTFSKAAADILRSFTIDGVSAASYKAPTANGAHTVVVTDTDAAGNTATNSINFKLDTFVATPTVALTRDTGTPGDLITRDAALTFSKAAADVIRSFTIDGASSASYIVPTAKGAHTVVVTDTDIAGNIATNSISFTLSKSTAPTPPPPPTPDPTPGQTVTASYVLQGVVPQQIAAAPFDVQVVETYSDFRRCVYGRAGRADGERRQPDSRLFQPR